MKQIIAIPMEDGNLCSHFGHCQTFAFVEVENGKIVHIKEEVPPEHVPGLYPKWVAGFGATDVIAGGMGQKAVMLFNEQNINVFVGAPITDAKTLVESFLDKTLSFTANYCSQEKHEHGDHQCRH